MNKSYFVSLCLLVFLSSKIDAMFDKRNEKYKAFEGSVRAGVQDYYAKAAENAIKFLAMKDMALRGDEQKKFFCTTFYNEMKAQGIENIDQKFDYNLFEDSIDDTKLTYSLDVKKNKMWSNECDFRVQYDIKQPNPDLSPKETYSWTNGRECKKCIKACKVTKKTGHYDVEPKSGWTALSQNRAMLTVQNRILEALVKNYVNKLRLRRP